MYLLTELVRLLERRGHAFSADPDAVTEMLRQTGEAVEERLHRRASLIDRRHDLSDQLHSHIRRLRLLFQAALPVWFAAGFSSAYALMRQSSLNFLFVLSAVLGANTLMLLFWLLWPLLRPQGAAHPPLSADRLAGGDSVGRALSALYAETALKPGWRWRRSQTAHALALSALCGMFAAALLLLAVRQYRFNWESTLFTDAAFARILAVLSWLPQRLGFAVPDAGAVAAVRGSAADTADAARWGGLLLGSILCYGILPRAAAWLFCRFQAARHPLALDLSLPYYQNIIQKWQRRITDSADDYRADAARPVPPAVSVLPQGRHWAVLIDAPHPEADWFYRILGQDWIDQGIAGSRSETAALAERLAAEPQPVQLLAGVRAHSAPDRGTVRRLAALAAGARAGMVVQLWAPPGTPPEQLAALLPQWHDALRGLDLPWMDPV